MPRLDESTLKPAAYDSVILSHYEKEAQEHGLEPSSTMQDRHVRERETEVILRFIELAGRHRRKGLAAGSALRIADVGCGNGYTLERVAETQPNAQLAGLEFTPALRQLAERRFAGIAHVRIEPGDLRRVDARWDASQDLIVCQRVVINILDAPDQARVRSSLVRMLKPGGFLITIECYTSAWERLNAARAEFGLPAIPPRFHNRYLPDDFFAQDPALAPVKGPRFDPALPDDFLPHNFLSNHYFAARVLHPLALGNRPFALNSHFVTFLSQALDRPAGDYSPIQVFAFERTA